MSLERRVKKAILAVAMAGTIFCGYGTCYFILEKRYQDSVVQGLCLVGGALASAAQYKRLKGQASNKE